MGESVQKKAHIWERDPDNWYVEPTWVSKRLFEVEKFHGRVVDPCAGMGNIVAGAAEAGVRVVGYDLRDRGYPSINGGVNFFDTDQLPGRWPVENIASNPPYGARTPSDEQERRRLEEEFLRVALQRSTRKVALFLPSAWLNGKQRGEWLESLPLYRVYFVAPRPSCPPGTMIQSGQTPGQGTADYAWYVFLHGFDGDPTLHFLRRDG